MRRVTGRRSGPLAAIVTGCLLLAGRTTAFGAPPIGVDDHGRPRALGRTYSGIVRIAAVQTAPRLLDDQYNLNVMLARTDEAASNGAQLVVFPELALNGYKYASSAEAMQYAEEVPGPSSQALAAKAAERGVYVVFGMLEKDGEDVFDAVVLVGPEGLVGKYHKMHEGYRSEALTFSRGDQAPPVFQTAIGRIGLGNCYDAAFPETARLLALQGVDILAFVNTENGTTWRDYIRSRGAEDGAYLVVANRVGGERFSTFNGYSLIGGPNYQLLAYASTSAEQIIYANADLGLLGAPPYSNRRPELYGALTAPLPRGILAADVTPESNVTGRAADVDVTVVTASIREGTPVVATLESSDGVAWASAEGALGFDRKRLTLSVPADVPAGAYNIKVAVGYHQPAETELSYTVKAVARPTALGLLPVGPGATKNGTIYISFDSEVKASTKVGLQLIGPTSTSTLYGPINTAGVDNRLSVNYSGLSYGQTYTVVLPAGSVQSASNATSNQEVRFQFTVQPAPVVVRAAAIQMTVNRLDTASNLAAISSKLTQAANAGAKLVVFPELTLTGSQFKDANEAASVAETVPGPSVDAIAAKARELGVYAVFGLVETDAGFCGRGDCAGAPGRPGKLYDSLVLVGPEGLVGRYHKTHLDPAQSDVFEQGEVPCPVFSTTLGPVGLTLGYESYYPEVARSLSVRGALLVAGAYGETGKLWTELARTRASENKVYVIAANRVGSEQGTTYGGLSLMAATSRKVLVQAGASAEQIITADLDMYDIQKRDYSYVDRATGKVRSTHYYLDRRPRLYGDLVWHAGDASTAPRHEGFVE